MWLQLAAQRAIMLQYTSCADYFDRLAADHADKINSDPLYADKWGYDEGVVQASAVSRFRRRGDVFLLLPGCMQDTNVLAYCGLCGVQIALPLLAAADVVRKPWRRPSVRYQTASHIVRSTINRHAGQHTCSGKFAVAPSAGHV